MIDNFCDDVLSYLELAEHAKDIPNRHRVDLKGFKDALLLSDQFDPYGGLAIFDSSAQPRDVNGEFDISSISHSTSGTDFSERDKQNHLFSIFRFRRISFKQARGLVSKFYPVMAEYSGGCVLRNGHAVTGRHFYGHTAQGWEKITSGYKRQIENKGWQERFGLAISMQFNRRYEWTASLSLTGGPSVCFITDPIGASEIFKLRDVEPGKLRRAAIKHWVREHWRKKRSDPNEETKVRKHLRGVQEFKWKGLHVRIKPSQFDAEENARSKQDRI